MTPRYQIAQDLERKRLFDGAAESYERYRPGHAEAAFDDIAELSGVAPPARVLEIGCGPGQATLPLARRGYLVRAIELGPRLAERARARLAAFPGVRIEVGSFEAAEVPESSCDLVVSASAFHWIDRAFAYPKIARGLSAGGALALLWSSAPREENPLRAELDEAYARNAPELVQRQVAHGQIAGIPQEIAATRLFGEVAARTYQWQVALSAEDYVGLMGTYSDHIALPAERRASLFEDVRRIVARHGGIALPMRTLLFVGSKARR